MGLNFIKESRMFYYDIQQKCIRVYVINVNHVLNHACTSSLLLSLPQTSFLKWFMVMCGVDWGQVVSTPPAPAKSNFLTL